MLNATSCRVAEKYPILRNKHGNSNMVASNYSKYSLKNGDAREQHFLLLPPFDLFILFSSASRSFLGLSFVLKGLCSSSLIRCSVLAAIGVGLISWLVSSAPSRSTS